MKDNAARFTLAIGALIIGGLSLASLMLNTVPASNREALFLALGLMLGLSKDAFGFYFGASKSGVDLSDRNAGIVEQAAASPSTQAVEVVNTPDQPVPTQDQVR